MEIEFIAATLIGLVVPVVVATVSLFFKGAGRVLSAEPWAFASAKKRWNGANESVLAMVVAYAFLAVDFFWMRNVLTSETIGTFVTLQVSAIYAIYGLVALKKARKLNWKFSMLPAMFFTVVNLFWAGIGAGIAFTHGHWIPMVSSSVCALLAMVAVRRSAKR